MVECQKTVKYYSRGHIYVVEAGEESKAIMYSVLGLQKDLCCDEQSGVEVSWDPNVNMLVVKAPTDPYKVEGMLDKALSSRQLDPSIGPIYKDKIAYFYVPKYP